jgi:glycolate oxidase
VNSVADPVIPAGALAAVLDELRGSAPQLRVLVDPVDRESYRLDETDYLVAGLPGAIVLPTTTAEVSEILAAATRHRLPVVPRGAGTGLSGGAAGIEGALTISLMRMERILEIDADNLCAVVQPGVVNAALKAAAAREGLFYPPDPASYETSSIGGNLGTNAGGLCCVKYGQTRDWVLALEVVLADGTVIRTGGRTVKDTAGYSLTHLIVGSQGTLGVITEATLRLRPLPGPRSTLLAPSSPVPGSRRPGSTSRWRDSAARRRWWRRSRRHGGRARKPRRSLRRPELQSAPQKRGASRLPPRATPPKAPMQRHGRR